MQLKHIVLSLALLSGTSAYADVVPASPSNFNGFYAGVNLGYQGLNLTESGQGVDGITQSLVSFSGVDDRLDALSIGPVLGYGQAVYKNFYWGQEVFANYLGSHTAYLTVNPTLNGGQPFNYRVNYNYGAALLPGYIVLPNVLWYGRFSLGAQNYNISTLDDAGTSHTYTGSDFFIGVGTGVSYQVMAHLNIRLEYEHDFYQTFSVYPTSLNDVLLNIPEDTTASNANKITLSLLYQF